jgi:hypothetical protein
MSLLPEDAQFEELVQDCFLAFHGAGVMLSPLDAELLSEWAAQQVPYDVVARGIRRAAERLIFDRRPDEPALHTLRSCRREVGAEIRKYLDRSAGAGSDPSAPVVADEDGTIHPERSSVHPERSSVHPERSRGTLEGARHKKLRSAVKKFGKQAPAYQPVAERLLAGLLASPPADLSEASRREDAVVAAVARGMPFPERARLASDVKARAQETAALSPRARRLSRRFHRAALLRDRVELPTFW